MRNPDPAQRPANGADTRAKLMLVLLCCIWGITWPLMKVALNEMPPLAMRASSGAFAALTLYLICLAKHRSLRIPSAKAWAHVVVASLLNIVAFSLFTAFAQLAAATSRVAIVSYTMPVWSVLFAWAFLGERPSRTQALALALCSVGLAVLICPLAASGVPLGILLASGTGVSWAAGTIYVKWARIDADPMGVASWQLTIAFVVMAACMFAVEGKPDLSGAHTYALSAMVIVGVAGGGIAYALWFEIIRRLPAATASLGVLGSPVIGVVASILILGERPTGADIIGFALILAASACVLLGRPATTLPAPAARGSERLDATP